VNARVNAWFARPRPQPVSDGGGPGIHRGTSRARPAGCGTTLESEHTTEQETSMSASETGSTTGETRVRMVKMNLEIQIIPVADVDRANGF
jgi:hypothetical protein